MKTLIKLLVLMGILSSIFGCKTTESNANSNNSPSIDPNDTMTYFYYYRGGGMQRFDGFRYLVEKTKDGRVHFLFNKDYPDEKEFTIDDYSVFDSLQQIVLKHKMYNYSGNYRPEFRVFDGQSWDFYVKYASGTTIRAGGYMAGPDGYGEAFREIRGCLDRWKETPVEVNGLVSFDFEYGTEHFHFEPQGDHALVTVDDEAAGRHEVLEKPMELMEELRVTTITEDLRDNGVLKSDDPNHIPFKFDIVFSNGDHYLYSSYDLNYKCHKTEVMHWFLSHWEIKMNSFK